MIKLCRRCAMPERTSSSGDPPGSFARAILSKARANFFPWLRIARMTEPPRLAVGVDLGASVLKLGLVDGTGQVRMWTTQQTPRSLNTEDFLAWWTSEVN